MVFVLASLAVFRTRQTVLSQTITFPNERCYSIEKIFSCKEDDSEYDEDDEEELGGPTVSTEDDSFAGIKSLKSWLASDYE